MTTFKTQPTNVFVPGPAIEFDANDEVWTIAPNVFVQSDTSYATVESNGFINLTLINKGHIFSVNNIGVNLGDGGNEKVVNTKDASIIGQYYGLYMLEGTQNVVNRGQIFGYSADGVYIAGGAAAITNYGDVYGQDEGVYLDQTGGSVENFGLIRSADKALYLSTTTNKTATVHNHAGGTIKGHAEAVYNFGYKLTLINEGRIVGDILDDGGLRDLIFNHHSIRGAVYLGAGNDLYDGHDGTVTGPIKGYDGNDHLIGGAGRQKFFGGDGLDRMTGHDGADRFFFDTKPRGTTNFDTITDFTPSQGDKIVLSEGVYLDIGPTGAPLQAQYFRAQPTAATPNQRILYNPINGALYYDQDGNGATYHPIHFATLTTHPTLHAGDFLVIA